LIQIANDTLNSARLEKRLILKRTFKQMIRQTLLSTMRTNGGRFGVIFVTLLVFLAVFSPWITPVDPNEQDIVNRFGAPSFSHFLGTDYLGRDILSRVIYGCRIAVMVAFGAVTISALVGVILGVLAGYKEGDKLDYAIILIFDIVRSFPQIILALALVAVLGSSIFNMILALAFTAFPFYGRVARAQTLSVKETDYVKAAEALGLTRVKIVFRHIIPNILSPIIVLVGMDMATMIIYEAGLSFLGLGVKPPTASWGTMLRDGYKYISTSPWMILWPSVTIAISMIAFSLFSEGLRVAMDPKERERKQ